MGDVDTAVEASTDIAVPEAEAAQLARLKTTNDSEVCATAARRYLNSIERRHRCSVLPNQTKSRLSALDPADTNAPEHLYALLRILPLQTVTEHSPEHTVITALTQSLCDPLDNDESVQINIDLIAVYLTTLAQAVKNARPSVPGTYYRSQLTDLTVEAFTKALRREPHGHPTRRSVQSEALLQLSVAAEEPVSLIHELLPVLTRVRDESPDAQCQQAAAEIIERVDMDRRAITPDQTTLDRNW